jgi:hypothetical protein
MSQLDLFRLEPSVPERQPPDLNLIRRHLYRALRIAGSAQIKPWSEAETQSWIDRFPRLAAHLPSEERAELTEAFDREIARLATLPALNQPSALDGGAA